MTSAPRGTIDIRTTYLRYVIDNPPAKLSAVSTLAMLHLAAAADDGELGLTREQIGNRLDRPDAIVTAVLATLLERELIRRMEPRLYRLAVVRDEPSGSSVAGIFDSGYPSSPPVTEGHQAVKKTGIASKSGRGGRS